jgi:hypothetical protein
MIFTQILLLFIGNRMTGVENSTLPPSPLPVEQKRVLYFCSITTSELGPSTPSPASECWEGVGGPNSDEGTDTVYYEFTIIPPRLYSNP